MDAANRTPSLRSRPRLATTPPRIDACPVAETARLVGKKWYLVLLHRLSLGPRGFNELKREARPISGRVLADNLRDLEADGLVTRTVRSQSPIRVEYDLTERGRDLQGLFDAMAGWGRKWALCDPESHPHAGPLVSAAT